MAADEQTSYTVQRQEQGKTVYLEQLPGGGYHETTTPGGGGYSGGVLFIPEIKKEEPKPSAPQEAKNLETAKPGDILFKVPSVVEALRPAQEKAKEKYLAGEPLTTSEVQLLGYEVQQRLAIEHKGGPYGAEPVYESKTNITSREGFGVYQVKAGGDILPGAKGENAGLILSGLGTGPGEPAGPGSVAYTSPTAQNIVAAANLVVKQAQVEQAFLTQNPDLGQPVKIYLNLPGTIGGVEARNEIETKESKALRAQQEAYAAKMPEGSEFGFGFGKLTTEALEKSTLGPREKVFIQGTGGQIPLALDIGAQAIKNLPNAAGAALANPVKFGSEGSVFAVRSVGAFSLGLITSGKEALEGNPEAQGQTLANIAVLGGGFVLHVRGINEAADANFKANMEALSEARLNRLYSEGAQTRIPIGIRGFMQKTGTGKLEEAHELISVEKPEGVNIIDGEARATYAKQFITLKVSGAKADYTTLIKSGETTLTSSATEAPFAITAGEGAILSPKEALSEMVKGPQLTEPGVITTPEGYFNIESLIPGAIRRSAAFNRIFNAREQETPISPLSERLEMRGTQRFFYKSELGKETPKEINFVATSELPGAKPASEVFGPSDIKLAGKEKGLNRVRFNIELPDVINAVEIAKKAESEGMLQKFINRAIPEEAKTKAQLKGEDITEVISGKGGPRPREKTPLKFEEVPNRGGTAQVQNFEVKIPKALLEAQKTQYYRPPPEYPVIYYESVDFKYPVITYTGVDMGYPEKTYHTPYKATRDYDEPTYNRYPPARETELTYKSELQNQTTRGLFAEQTKGGFKTPDITTQRGLNLNRISDKLQIKNDINTRQLYREREEQKGLTKYREETGLTNRLDEKGLTLLRLTQQGITSQITRQGTNTRVKRQIPEILISGGELKKFGFDEKKLRRFKLPRSKTRAGLQPFLTLPEKAGLELKTGRAIRGAVLSTPRTRAIYRGALLKGAFSSGLLGGRKRRRK